MFTLIIPKWTDVTITVDGPYEAAYSAARGLNQLKNLTVLSVTNRAYPYTRLTAGSLCGFISHNIWANLLAAYREYLEGMYPVTGHP